MNIAVELSTLQTLHHLRLNYVAQLRGGLEGYLEDFALKATPYAVLLDGQVRGYVCIGPERRLWQFHLLRQATPAALAVLQYLIEAELVNSAIVSTRDPLALGVCAEFQRRFWVQAFLFEDHHPFTETPAACQGAHFRPAHTSDAQPLAALAGDFLADYPAEIAAQRVYLLKRDNTILGMGLNIPVGIHPPFSCIGMFVNPQFRKQGIGAYVLQQVKEVCYDHGQAPIAGCGHGNVASRKTLEKAGLITYDRLLGFEF